MESRQRLGELTSQLRVSAVRLENADDLSVEHRIQMGRDVLYTLQRTTMVLKKARTLIWAAKVPKVAIKTVQDTLIYIDELARTAVSITAPAVEEDLRIYAQELAKTTKQADDAQIDVGDYESLKTAKASPDKTLGRTLESARALPERLLLTPDLTEGESTASKNEFSSDEAHEDKAETASALMAFPPVVGGGAQSLERVEYIPTGRMLEIEDLATPDAERTLRGAVRLTRDRLLDHTSVDKAFTNRYRETKRRGRSKGGRSTWDRLAGDCYLDRLRREQRRRTGRPNMSLRETIRALEGFDELIYAMTPYSAEVSSSPAHGPVTETVSATERQESTESSEPVVKLNSKDEFIYPIAPVDTIVEDDSHPKTKALTKTSISALGSEDLDFANDGNQELSSETLVETAFVGRSPSKSRSETSNSGPKLAQDNLVDAEIAVRLADARRGLALAKYARASEPNPGYALMRRRATIERMRLSDALTAKHLGNELYPRSEKHTGTGPRANPISSRQGSIPLTSSTAPDSDSEGHSTNELQAPRQTLATEDLAQHLSSSVLGRPLSEQAHDEADGLLISTIGRQPRLPENLSDRATVLRMNILRLWRLETGNGMPLLISRCKQQIWMAEQDLSYLAHYVVPNKGGRLEIMKQDRHTLKDKLQLQLEHSTGLAWDWWPLSAPRKPLARGMLRIRWEMDSGNQYYEDVSDRLGLILRQALDNGIFEGQDIRTHPVAEGTSNSVESGSSETAIPLVLTQPSAAHLRPFPTRMEASMPKKSATSQTLSQSNHGKSRICTHPLQYVLFCVPASRLTHATQLRVNTQKSDKDLFKELRTEYRAMRGLLRRWLSPKQYSHCCFSRMTRWAPNRLSFDGFGVPHDKEYIYSPRPPDWPYIPNEPWAEPIRRDEWFERFHGFDSGLRREVVPMIPKRCKAFQTTTHTCKAPMWGLNVYYRLSMLGVVAWAAVVGAGPMYFWGWWLSGHPGDWQTAVTPLTTVLAVLLALFMALGREFVEVL